MSGFGVVEDTLFVPMAGRIYAGEHCPGILYDEKALALKEKLSGQMPAWKGQSQYTLLASASRAANMDRFVRKFLNRKPDGVIVQLGCGLETAYYRCDNGRTCWYAVDLPNVMEYRNRMIPEPEREKYLPGDAFSEEWIREARAREPDAPILITAGGLFYYFEKSRILGLLRKLTGYGDIEVVFDAVNRSGMMMMRKKYMKQVGHADARMFFYVDSAEKLATQIGNDARVLAEEAYYQYISRTGLKPVTKISMAVSDRFEMVKMVHLKL